MWGPETNDSRSTFSPPNEKTAAVYLGGEEEERQKELKSVCLFSYRVNSMERASFCSRCECVCFHAGQKRLYPFAIVVRKSQTAKLLRKCASGESFLHRHFSNFVRFSRSLLELSNEI